MQGQMGADTSAYGVLPGNSYGQLAQAMSSSGLSVGQSQSGIASGINPAMSDFMTQSYSPYAPSHVSGVYPGISSYPQNQAGIQTINRRYGYMPSMDVYGAPVIGAPMIGPPVLGPPVIGGGFYQPRLPYGNPYYNYDSYSPLVPVY